MKIIDVRTKEEFDTAHNPNSINIPLVEFNQRLHEIPRNEKVVLVCKSGARAKIAHDICKGNGLNNVFSAGAWDDVGLEDV